MPDATAKEPEHDCYLRDLERHEPGWPAKTCVHCGGRWIVTSMRRSTVESHSDDPRDITIGMQYGYTREDGTYCPTPPPTDRTQKEQRPSKHND